MEHEHHLGWLFRISAQPRRIFIIVDKQSGNPNLQRSRGGVATYTEGESMNSEEKDETEIERRPLLRMTAAVSTVPIVGCIGSGGQDSGQDPGSETAIRNDSDDGNSGNETTSSDSASDDSGETNRTGSDGTGDDSDDDSGNETVVVNESVMDEITDTPNVNPNISPDDLPTGPPGSNLPVGGSGSGGDGGATLKDPTKVANSGAVKVVVTPKNLDGKTGDKPVGGKKTEETEEMVCTTQKRRITAGGSMNWLLNPELDVIWPGEILEAGSIAKGQYSRALSRDRRGGVSTSQIRNPIKISVSLRNIDKENGEVIQTPTQSNFRTALDDLLSRYDRNANTPSEQGFTLHQVHSSEQLNVEFGAHYNSPTVKVDNKFDFSNRSRTNKIFAKYWQKYYSVDIDMSTPAANASGFVTDPKYLRRNDVIVSSVDYGRLLLFSAESSYRRNRVENALKASFKGIQSGSVSLDVDHKNVLRDTEINVQVLGGAATQGAKVISKPGEKANKAFESIKNWVEKGARYDPKRSPGVPISYQTKYLKTGDTANTYLTTTYNSRNCRPKTMRYKVHNFSWKVLKWNDPNDRAPNKEEIFGEIWVEGFPKNSEGEWMKAPPVLENHLGRIEPKSGDTEVWERGEKQYLEIGQGEIKMLGSNSDAIIKFKNFDEIDKSKSRIDVVARPVEHDRDVPGFNTKNEFGDTKTESWFLNQPPSDPDRAAAGGGSEGGSDDGSEGESREVREGKFKIPWSDKGSRIQLAFDITPLPPSKQE